jgi:hypothetical protein
MSKRNEMADVEMEGNGMADGTTEWVMGKRKEMEWLMGQRNG